MNSKCTVLNFFKILPFKIEKQKSGGTLSQLYVIFYANFLDFTV